MNGGHIKTNSYYKDATETAKDLFLRQEKHAKMKNQLLFKDDLAMHVEIDRLQKEPPSETTRDLIKAARDLSLPDYELYKRFARRKDTYLRLTSTPDGEGANAEKTTVQSINHPNAPPRVLRA